MFTAGSKVTMTPEAIENYGEEWDGVMLTVTAVSTKYMPAREFYRRGMPDGYHPGFDGEEGDALYDFDEFNCSLYDWELIG